MLLDALAGVDAVIHLAAQNPYPDASWEDASASFDMTAKLVDTCAKASVSRLVFASSNHVMGGYKDTPVAPSDGGLSTDLPPLVGTRVGTSEGLIDSTAYAAAKLMGERVVAGEHARSWGVSRRELRNVIVMAHPESWVAPLE
jgi:nucleoside-diphosphate-sugar epimerase